jgi:hypothetical protein
MGWFNRPATVAAPVGPEPIVADSHELAHARELLRDFERSQTTGGTEASARAAILAISQAGSGWPWQWLAAVTESAAARGDGDLVAHAAFFTLFWLRTLSPRINAKDERDMRLARGVPDPSRGEIVSAGLRVLPAMDPRLPVVVDHVNADDCISLGQVAIMCAIEARGDATAVGAAERATAERVLRSAGLWAAR